MRFWSAVTGIATVYLVYAVSRHLLSNSQKLSPLLAAILAAFTPGLIQISHFGTTESLLSFFFLMIVFLCLKILEKPKFKYYIFSGIILGLALGSKISALIFGFPMFLVFLIQFVRIFKNKSKLKNIGLLLSKNLIFLTFLILLTLLTSPYLVLAYQQSRGTLLYETSVATGTSRVFYTRQFIGTIPILFQAEKIFPYALGWPIYILGITGMIITTVQLIKNLRVPKFVIRNSQFAIFLFSFLLYFLSQAFLFTKWTRFQAPIFAFFPIFASLSLSYLRNLRHLSYLLIFLSIVPGIIFSSVYFLPDIRFTASNWIYNTIPSGSQILYDTGNVADLPMLSPNRQNISNLPNYSGISFDFYNLDENYELFPKLINYLESSDYIFVPSRRVFINHMRQEKMFPKTAKYYSLLFSGKLGFKEIKSFVPFTSIVFKDEKAEETFSVFDHPTIRIYQKTVNMTKEQYEELFK